MKKINICFIFFLIIPLLWIIFLFNNHFVYAGNSKENTKKQVFFSTWEGFEPDKCASIWLIQRFIDEYAEIKFFPRGELIEKGIPFDTPDARFRRYANKSTFESFMDHYKLNDPKLIYIGKIIHDIEINIWERKIMEETFRVQDAITKIINETKDSVSIIKEGNRFFDNLYNELEISDIKD